MFDEVLNILTTKNLDYLAINASLVTLLIRQALKTKKELLTLKDRVNLLSRHMKECEELLKELKEYNKDSYKLSSLEARKFLHYHDGKIVKTF